MKILFMAQSKTLSVFFETAELMIKSGHFESAGFYISDSAFFHSFQKKHPALVSGDFLILKEWDILEKARNRKYDIGLLKKYEKRYGDPLLWNPLVADRRIYLGRKATLEQDYASRLDHNGMLSVLQTTIEELETLFDRHKPEAVVAFICVTAGEYLAYLIAKARNIPFIDLRPTRIMNYFHAGDSVQEPSIRLSAAYNRTKREGIPENLGKEAKKYLERVRTTHAMYEGVIPADKKVRKKIDRRKSVKKTIEGKIKTALNVAGRFYRNNFGEYRFDGSWQGAIYPLWFTKLKKPVRKKLIELRLGSEYSRCLKYLSLSPYAFFPLHKEPEVTLLVYGRSYLNQIEVVRNIGRSLPVGVKLVVKEHPAAVGYRPLEYYQKLISVPNVVLAPPNMTSRELIQNALLVTIIGGSVGLEAIFMKKPVITLGRVPFSYFPKNMVRYGANPEHLGDEITDLLNCHRHDEDAVIAYLAAVFETSAPIDFYSKLLARKGVYSEDPNDHDEKERNEHLKRLAEYIMESFQYYRDSQQGNPHIA